MRVSNIRRARTTGWITARMAGVCRAGLVVLCVGIGPTVLAHDLAEVKETLGDAENIPTEILEATQTLQSTAGTSSVRDLAHEKQHQLLLEHVRVRTKQKCHDLIARLPRLNDEIASLREAGQKEQEQALRDVRETAEEFVRVNCAAIEQLP